MHLGTALLEVGFPLLHGPLRDEIALVEDEDELLLRLLDDVVEESWGKVQRHEANVEDQEDDITHFEHAPELAPCLEIELKVRDLVIRALVANLFQELLECSLLVSLNFLLQEGKGGRGGRRWEERAGDETDTDVNVRIGTEEIEEGLLDLPWTFRESKQDGAAFRATWQGCKSPRGLLLSQSRHGEGGNGGLR